MERLSYAGGNWNNGSNAGVFYSNGNNGRSNVNTNIGFRAAFLSWPEGGRLRAIIQCRGMKGVCFPCRADNPA